MQSPLQIRHTFFQMGTVIYRSYHIVLGFRKISFFSRTLWYIDFTGGEHMAPYSIEELRMIASPIAQAHGVESVSLFGSYSNGTADAHSDVDLKIEKAALRSLFQICGFRLVVEGSSRTHGTFMFTPTVLSTFPLCGILW